ncbi:hypothetical protein [Motiliproteus sp.]|uniref:hypothetical protein n=1 Tax=Motiliproteus sp. TaxID=1898955 RepID=UPI003BA8DA6D
MDKVDHLLLLEYEAHQARYRQLAERSSSLQQSVIVLSAAVWAWTLTEGTPQTTPLLICLPASLTLLFAAYAAFLHVIASDLHVRLAEIEQRLGQSIDVGLYQRRQRGEKTTHDRFVLWIALFWTVILLLNLLMAMWVQQGVFSVG